jgi:multiple sugar transport system ATP-binding protein
MNTVEAEVVERDGRTVLESVEGNAFAYDLGAAGEDHPVRVGERVTVGVRPEDVVLRADADAFEDQHHPTTVDVVEPLGSDNLLYFDVGPRTWTARVSPGFEPESGATVHFSFPREALYVFDEDGTTVESRNLGSPEEARAVARDDGVVNR